MVPPTLAEVEAIVPPTCIADVDYVDVDEVLWGPISPADARDAGSEFPASSLLFEPGIDPGAASAPGARGGASGREYEMTYNLHRMGVGHKLSLDT